MFLHLLVMKRRRTRHSHYSLLKKRTKTFNVCDCDELMIMLLCVSPPISLVNLFANLRRAMKGKLTKLENNNIMSNQYKKQIEMNQTFS